VRAAARRGAAGARRREPSVGAYRRAGRRCAPVAHAALVAFAADPGALVTEFIRTRTPLKLARRGAEDAEASRAALRDESASDSEPSTSGASTPRVDLTVPWQILGPLPRLPWELPKGAALGARQVQHLAGGRHHGVRARRRG
jgi:hypothetical protein